MLAKLIQILCLFNVFLLLPLTEQYCGNNCKNNKKTKTMMIQLLNNEDWTEKTAGTVKKKKMYQEYNVEITKIMWGFVKIMHRSNYIEKYIETDKNYGWAVSRISPKWWINSPYCGNCKRGSKTGTFKTYTPMLSRYAI